MFTLNQTLTAIIEEVITNAEGLASYEQRTPAGTIEVFDLDDAWEVRIDGMQFGTCTK